MIKIKFNNDNEMTNNDASEEIYCDGYGFIMHSNQRNLDGKIVERSKFKYPYSYDEFTVWKSNDFEHGKSHKVYSDRLRQWDYEKFNKCSLEAFEDGGQMFYNRAPKDIEKFLQLYTGENIKLTGIVEGCNVSNGYPYWAFYYKNE